MSSERRAGDPRQRGGTEADDDDGMPPPPSFPPPTAITLVQLGPWPFSSGDKPRDDTFHAPVARSMGRDTHNSQSA